MSKEWWAGQVISHILHCHSTVYQMRSPISARGVWGPAVPAGSWQWCSPWQASTMALYWARNINTTMRGLNCTNNIHGVWQTDWKRSKKRKPKQEFWNQNPKTDHGLCGHGRGEWSAKFLESTNFIASGQEIKFLLPLGSGSLSLEITKASGPLALMRHEALGRVLMLLDTTFRLSLYELPLIDTGWNLLLQNLQDKSQRQIGTLSLLEEQLMYGRVNGSRQIHL